MCVLQFKNFVEKNEGKLQEAATIAKNAIDAASANIQWADKVKDELGDALNPPTDDGANSLATTGFLALLACFVARFV